MMEIREVKFNSFTKGFALYIYKTEKFVFDKKTKKRKIFKNLEEAKNYAWKRISKNPYDYRIWVFVNDLEIPFDDIEWNNGYFEYYDTDNNILYRMQEMDTEMITSIGYLVFYDGDNPESTTKISKDQSHEIYEIIKNAMENQIDVNSPGKSIKPDSNGHLTLSLYGTSIKFHLLYNSQIMDINSERKKQEIRCIPYDKKMDKYRTFFLYTSCIMNAEDDPAIIDVVRDKIIDFIVANDCPDVKYVPVDFHGIVKL